MNRRSPACRRMRAPRDVCPSDSSMECIQSANASRGFGDFGLDAPHGFQLLSSCRRGGSWVGSLTHTGPGWPGSNRRLRGSLRPERSKAIRLCQPYRSQAFVDERRRHAAVLFADLSGFTALVDRLEPEDVYARVRPLIDELVGLAETHGGEIQQVLGDGFMAVFGLRSASHDASRTARAAVTAGMALVGVGRGHNGRLPVHVGVECGEVLISSAWEPARFAVGSAGHGGGPALRTCRPAHRQHRTAGI
jgi:hypothetical protein